MGSPRIEVQVRRDDEGKFFARVRLFSVMRPTLVSQKDLNLDDFGSEDEFCRAVAVTGGALAEHQDENYGDAHDPDECARVAGEEARRMLIESSTR